MPKVHWRSIGAARVKRPSERARCLRWMLMTCGTFVAIVACSSADEIVQPGLSNSRPLAARDTVIVTSWRRPSLFVANTRGTVPVQTESAFLTYSQTSLSGVDPRTGRGIWTVPFPALPQGFRGVGNVFRASYTSGSGVRSETVVDDATGMQLWTQPIDSLVVRTVITASTSTVLELVNDTVFVGRDRASGVVRWTRRAPSIQCTSSVDDCVRFAGYANGTFFLIQAALFSAQQRLITLTEAGVFTVVPFADPSSRGFTIFESVALDSASNLLLYTTFSGAGAVDVTSGASRWTYRYPLASDGVFLEPAVANILTGREPRVQLLFPYEEVANGNFAREVVLDATSGAIVRQFTRPISSTIISHVGPCGADGMVFVRTDGRFLFSNARSGVDTEGMVRDSAVNVRIAVPEFANWQRSYATGHVVFRTSDNTTFGFRCKP